MHHMQRCPTKTTVHSAISIYQGWMPGNIPLCNLHACLRGVAVLLDHKFEIQAV